jgi:hypothetical protein
MRVLPLELERCDPGGLFVRAALAFLEPRLDAPLGRDADGVRRLTTLIVRHAYEGDGDADESFIEGCGAALGLLVADALSGTTCSRGGRHAVLVGDHGTFDPFTVVRAALDADDPREVVALGLEEAEREADGRGPVAASLRAFLRALEHIGIEAKIVDRLALDVVLDDGTEVDLSRIRAAGDAGDAVARHLARMLGARSTDGEGFVEVRERILPRVVGDAFLARLGDKAPALAQQRIADGLHLALIAHYGDRARFVRHDELEAGGEALHDACRLALLRLAHRSASLSFQADGETVMLASRDGLDAARILLPALPGLLVDTLGHDPFVSAPHRDLLLASRDAGVLRALTRDAFARAPHGVSPRVYRFESGRVVCDE